MAAEYGYRYQFSDSSRTISLSPVLIFVLIIGIVIGFVAAGFFAMGQIADSSSEGIDVVVQIHGNDVQVTLLPGGKVNQITGLHVYVDGHDPSSEACPVVHDPLVGSWIQFAGVAKNVTGSEFVIVEATFADGTQTIIEYARMRFS